MGRKRKRSVYLAGSMGAKRNRGRTWRRNITPFLDKIGFAVDDPCVFEEQYWRELIRSYGANTMNELKITQPSAYMEIMEGIELKDLAAIRKCTDVIFYIDKQVFMSDGTIMELQYACKLKKKLWFMIKMPRISIPGWSAWRISRHGFDKGRAFYDMKDLRAAIKVDILKGGK